MVRLKHRDKIQPCLECLPQYVKCLYNVCLVVVAPIEYYYH
jgi:hypothetical protein